MGSGHMWKADMKATPVVRHKGKRHSSSQLAMPGSLAIAQGSLPCHDDHDLKLLLCLVSNQSPTLQHCLGTNL